MAGERAALRGGELEIDVAESSETWRVFLDRLEALAAEGQRIECGPRGTPAAAEDPGLQQRPPVKCLGAG